MPFSPPAQPDPLPAWAPELGAAFLCADLAPESRPDHATYVASWLRVLRGDKRAIFTATAKA
jgi:antirestriction protein ArdC